MNLVNLITKDVISENETKRGIVSLRILYLVVITAFTLDNLLAGTEVFRQYPLRIALFYALIVVLFLWTYKSTTGVAMICFSVFIFLWTLSMIPCYGWSAGMQNYFIVILMLSFFAVHSGAVFKFILAGLILALRIITIFIFGGMQSGIDIVSSADKLIQITNISSVFISVIFISYIFSRDENEAETKLMKYNDRLAKEAGTDELTGLNNRRKAMEYLDRISKAGHYNSISIAMGDIDFFKDVNDTYGHDAGDEVLKYVANTFKSICKDSAFISRWGGEEFLIIFPNKNGDDAFIILEDIRNHIKDSVIKVKGNDIKITITFGLTEYDFRSDIKECVKSADERLYTGKNSGRDCVIY